MRTKVYLFNLPTSPEFFEADYHLQRLVRSALDDEKDPLVQNQRVKIIVCSSPFRAANTPRDIECFCLIDPGGIGDHKMPRFLGVLERVIEDFCIAKRFDARPIVEFSIITTRSSGVERIERDPPSTQPKRHARKASVGH
jgi:hypothetical protein